jgi:DNA-binding NarL/FixJ family response regulator
MAAQLRPHEVVLDIGMPGVGGLAAAHRISRDAPGSKVLVLSQYDDEEYVIEALGEAGAASYLVKTDAASELLSAVTRRAYRTTLPEPLDRADRARLDAE